VTPRVDPAERRDEIVQAAMRCFARTGYHGTSMDDIVAESGLSKGTLYWHFENKQALFLAMLEAAFEGYYEAFGAVITGGGAASERVRQLTKLTLKVFMDEKKLAELVVDFWAESRRDEAINQFFRDIYQPYIDTLARIVEQGIERGEFRQVDARIVASALAAMFDGLPVQAMIGIPIEDYLDADSLADWILSGLLPR
jgi:AcrR family transcriptional regulator